MKHLIVFAFKIWALSILILSDYSGTALAFDLLAYIPDPYIDDSGDAAVSGLMHPPDIRHSVVRVYTGNENPGFNDIHGKSSSQKINGSGSIIKGNMILTSAHVVANHGDIQVRKFNEYRKYKASLHYISHDYDVALLTVDDEHFFSDVAPIDLGELPDAQQKITVYGFPGVEELVTSTGLFSKTEIINYMYSGKTFPAGKLQASVKPGNSGGPVIYSDKLIGIVMQVARKGEITVMVPSQIIKQLLRDLRDNDHGCLTDACLPAQTINNVI